MTASSSNLQTPSVAADKPVGSAAADGTSVSAVVGQPVAPVVSNSNKSNIDDNGCLPPLMKWLFFSVLATLVPLFAAFLRASSQANASDVSTMITSVVSRGQLLLVAIALCSAACGEVFYSDIKERTRKVVVGGACFLIAFIATIYYMDISGMYSTNEAINTNTIRVYSLWIFLGSLMASGSAVYLTRK